MPRQSLGRQKIAIEKIKNENSLNVAFSKRRTGLFNKASEICTLCGVRMAIIVFSPSGKVVYSFGNPNVEDIIYGYLEEPSDPQIPKTSEVVEEYRNSTFKKLNTKLTDMLAQLEAKKNVGKDLKQKKQDSEGSNWWDAPIADLGVDQLEILRGAMLELKAVSEKEAKRLTAEAAKRTPIITWL